MPNNSLQTLRGIAITGVLVYHLGLTQKSGFLGVDVFFVISGYLIFKGIVRDRDGNLLSLKRFMTKRVFRIHPALIITLLSVSFISLLYLSPLGELQTSSQASILSLIFVSNYYFLSNVGSYFDDYADSIPTLHLWSLSVEFQVWLIFFFIALALRKIRKKKIFKILFFSASGITLATISVVERYFFIDYELNQFAFYSTGIRGFELLLGALAFSFVDNPKKSLSSKNVKLQTILLTFCIFIYFMPTENSSYSRLILLGICLAYLASGEHSSNSRIMIFLSGVGNYAYVLYLIHWPIIVFVRQTLILGNFGKLMLIAFGILLVFYLHQIELKFIDRSRHLIKSNQQLKGIPKLTFFSFIIAIVLAFPGYAAKGGGFNSEVKEIYLSKKRSSDQCHNYQDLKPLRFCTFNQNENNEYLDVLLVGDSHASVYTDSLIDFGKRNQLNVGITTSSGCPVFPLDLIRQTSKSNCISFSDHVVKIMNNYRPIKTVLVTRVGSYLNATPRVGEEPENVSDVCIMSRIGEKACGSENDLIRLYNKTKDSFFKSIPKNSQIIEVLEQPEFYFAFEKCTSIFQISEKCFTIPRSDIDRRYDVINRLFFVRDNRRHMKISVKNHFCDANVCSAFDRGGRILFYDSHHLNLLGAQIVFSKYIAPVLV